MNKNKFTPIVFFTLLIVALLASACQGPSEAEIQATVNAAVLTAAPAAQATPTSAPAATADPTTAPAATGTFLPPPTPPIDQTTGAPVTQSAPTTDAPPDQTACMTEWPEAAEKAAAIFGGTADRYFQTAEGGGWQIREKTWTTLVDPKGCLAQGYYDTTPGKNPRTIVFNDSQQVQGATVWPLVGTKANAEWLRPKMVQPVWDDGSQPPIEILIQ